MKSKKNIKSVIEFLSVYMFFTFGCIFDLLSYWGVNISLIRKCHIIVIIKFIIWALLIVIHFKRKIDIKVICFVNGYLLLLYSSFLFGSEKIVYLQEMFRFLILYIIPLIIILYCIAEPEIILKYIRYSGYIFLIKTWLVPFSPAYGSTVDYMRFAYSSIVVWSVVTQDAFKTKRPISVLFSIITIIIYFLYASRGASLAVIAYIAYCIYSYTDIKGKVKVFLMLAVCCWGGLLFNNVILLTLHHFGTYSITRIFNGSYFSSDSRLAIYNNMLDAIKKNPFGYGIGEDRVIGGGRGFYAHNVFLELSVAFGVFFTMLFMILCIVWMYRMLFRCKLLIYRDLFSVFAIPSAIILNLSSSLFIEYYVFAAVICCFLYYNALQNQRHSSCQRY